jgi:hypothetical protein
MSWSQQDTSFKKLQNKRITTSTGKGIDEEKGASALELYLPDIKTDLIPGTPPGTSTSVLSYTGSIGQTFAVDTSVPGNLTWFATSGYGNTTSANDGSAGSEALRLGDWISDKYDAFGTVSGSGYEVKVYDKDSNLITKADPSDWLFDYQTGILIFNSSSTTYGAVTSTGPFRVAGYRYIGNKGIISANYGGLGYTSYTKGDLLVGAGSTFIKLNVGSNDYVLTADSTSSSGLKWAVSTGGAVGSGITTLNSLTATSQSFEVGTAGNVFNISSIGSSHTFNIPIAGSGSTGLITTLAQTIAGQKTFTSAILADLTGTATTAGYATTAGFATTASYAHQSGYAITSGLATTASNLNLVNVSSGTYYPVLSNTSSSVNGIGASVNSFFSFNAANGAFGATSISISAGNSYSINGNSVLSATSLGTGVTNSSLTALGTITTGTWAGTLITARYGGTGYNTYAKGDILVGVGNTLAKLSVGNDLTILAADSSSGTGLTWKGLLTPTYGAFGSTTTQNVIAANTITLVSFNTVFYANNVSIGSGITNRVYINDNGIFDVQFSSQMSLSTGNTPQTIDMWFLVDGVPIPNSGTRQTVTGKDQESVLTVNLVQPFFSGQYIQLAYSSPDVHMTLGAFSNLTSPTRPDIPSIILTVEPISGILPGSGLAVTGLASLNLLTSNAQTLVTGTSGVDFNINSIGSVHTFNIPDASTTARGLITTGSQTLLGSKTFASGVAITSTTASTSSSTGALVVSGGVGIGQTLFTSSSYASSISGVVLNNSVITTGTWAGSSITAYYGGTGHSSYTKGDILVGVGNTLAKLPVGTDAYILSASSASAIGLSWTANTSVGGSGTSAYVPVWTSSGTNLTDSIMQQFESTMIISGQLKAITKSFKIDHPIYPEKMYLEHGSLEGPEHGAYQRGTGKGIYKVIINLPDYWAALVEDNYTIHITSKCKHNLYVYSQSPNNFEIRRIGNSILRREYIEFDYFIIGERKDIKIIIEQNK